jgi:hypothetical protein
VEDPKEEELVGPGWEALQAKADTVSSDRRVADRYAQTIARVAKATGWRPGTWSSGAPCLRKPCGRVASDRELAAVLATLEARESRLGGPAP